MTFSWILLALGQVFVTIGAVGGIWSLAAIGASTQLCAIYYAVYYAVKEHD